MKHIIRDLLCSLLSLFVLLSVSVSVYAEGDTAVTEEETAAVSAGGTEPSTTISLTFFGREADTGGYNNWMNKLSSGTSRDTVLMGFANSKEFANIMAKYGIR